MRMARVTMHDLETAVAKVNVTYDGNLRIHQDAHESGNAVVGRIDVRDSRGKGARKSWSGRRVRSACWHAYRDVLSALFDQCPDAVVTTALARYAGREGFEREYPRTAYHDVGSMMAPAYMPELCECES